MVTGGLASKTDKCKLRGGKKASPERSCEWREERQETDSQQPSGNRMRQTDISPAQSLV